MATSAPYDPYELLPNSHKIMLAALMKQMAQPQYSPVGAGANALAMGLMGLYEGQDEKQKIAGMDAQILGAPRQSSVPAVSSPMGNVPPVSDASPPSAPTLSPQTPTRPMISDYPTGPATVAALRGGPSEADMAANDVADSLSATGMKVSPEAVARLMKVESNNNPRSQSGSYAGATQMGPDTFKEAGGRLGGMTYPEYQNGSLTQQAWAYPDWLKQYNIPGKLQAAGVDTGQMSPAQQYGVLQAAQFAPNGGGDGNSPPPWMTAAGQGNLNVPSTTTPQANVLGNKSVAAMAGSFPQTQMADASGNVSIPQGARTAGPANPQVAQAQPQQAPQPPRVTDPAQVAQASPVYMEMNRQTNMLREQYRNASNAQKAILGPQILDAQNKMRDMEQQLQKEIFLQDYKNTHPSYSESQGTYGERNTRTLAREKALGESDAAVPVAVGKGLAKQAETAGEARGKIEGTLPIAEANLNMALKDSEALRKHPGRESSMGSFMGNVPDALIPANTSARDFVDRLGQVKGQSFLKAYETLKGGGSITEVEGAKATSAMNRMNRSLTQPEFENALNDYQDAIRTGLAKLRETAGQGPAPQQSATPPTGQFDYGSVKPGETYTAPDGSRRIKR